MGDARRHIPQGGKGTQTKSIAVLAGGETSGVFLGVCANVVVFVRKSSGRSAVLSRAAAAGANLISLSVIVRHKPRISAAPLNTSIPAGKSNSRESCARQEACSFKRSRRMRRVTEIAGQQRETSMGANENTPRRSDAVEAMDAAGTRPRPRHGLKRNSHRMTSFDRNPGVSRAGEPRRELAEAASFTARDHRGSSFLRHTDSRTGARKRKASGSTGCSKNSSERIARRMDGQLETFAVAYNRDFHGKIARARDTAGAEASLGSDRTECRQPRWCWRVEGGC